MGIVTSGIPAQITLQLAALGGADVFIETGTYLGGTTKWASTHFDRVYTIERAENLYRQNSVELSGLKGVLTLLGDSRQVLPAVLKEGITADAFKTLAETLARHIAIRNANFTQTKKVELKV